MDGKEARHMRDGIHLLKSVEYLIHKGYRIKISVGDSSHKYSTEPVWSLTFFNGARVHILYTILDHSIEDMLAIVEELCAWELFKDDFATAEEPEPVVCSGCSGSGMGYHPNSKCRRCGGSGELTELTE